jgi:phosphoglycolate phosphatase/putative hydrolase of the HAD superfamily
MTAAFDPERWDAVVFDVDGTLYEQSPLRRKMAVELLAYCALRPWRVGLLRRLQTFRRQREMLGEEESEGVRRLQYEQPARALGVDSEELRREVEEWMERRPLRHLASCRVAGARRFFAMLRASDTRIAVLSDYPAAAKLAALGLEAELVVSGTDAEIDRLKPRPEGLQSTVERLAVEPSHCLMIGDRDDRDGECARRAGVPYLLRLPGEAIPGSRFGTFVDLLPAGRGPSAMASD